MRKSAPSSAPSVCRTIASARDAKRGGLGALVYEVSGDQQLATLPLAGHDPDVRRARWPYAHLDGDRKHAAAVREPTRPLLFAAHSRGHTKADPLPLTLERFEDPARAGARLVASCLDVDVLLSCVRCGAAEGRRPRTVAYFFLYSPHRSPPGPRTTLLFGSRSAPRASTHNNHKQPQRLRVSRPIPRLPPIAC